SFSTSKETLPMATWIPASLFIRNSTLPALICRTASATSIVTVPDLGLGITPLGPRMRPNRPTSPIMSGVATATSKSMSPASILGQIFRAHDVGAGRLGLLGLLTLGEDGDPHLLA